MVDYRYFQVMYQQWCDGQSNAATRWMDFINMASRNSGIQTEILMKELFKCSWFKHN